MDFHNKDAIYLQIVEMICENILTKQWLEGEKIPSVRELAVNVEVNPNTVMRYGQGRVEQVEERSRRRRADPKDVVTEIDLG